jgi:uncharacterized membrane protein
MRQSPVSSEHPGNTPAALPFVAPSRKLATKRPLKWVKRGWRDFRHAPGISLLYGGLLVLLCYVLAFFTLKLGGYILLISLMSGFVFIAPVLAIGLYSISCQLQYGLPPRITYCLREGRRHLADVMVFSLVLLVIFLVWARAASMVHVFFPIESQPDFTDMVIFLAVGSAVGSVFAALIFCASAFSLPMMLDRKVDTITAVLTSVNAVLQNKAPMALWALMIALALLIGFATAFLGFVILMPVLGYATWHGYLETIEAGAWPENRLERIDT